MKTHPRITIVAHALSAGGGISVGKNLIRLLQQELPEAAYQVFIPSGLGYEDCIMETSDSSIHPYRGKNKFSRLRFDRYCLEKEIAQFRPDVVLCLGNRGVRYSSALQMVLCHDPHLFYPSRYYAREVWSKKIVKWLQRRRLAHDLRRTDMLLLQTNVAEERVRKVFGYSGEIMLLPNAVSVDVHAASTVLDIPLPLKKEQKSFNLFYLTRYYPHKNLEILVQLFERYRDALEDCRLFITIEASQHPLAAKLLQKIDRSGLGRQIINLGPLKQHELPAYFSHADALIMPTTLESFSGTYLEAMSFECPVLTSDLDFAKEICGDAALYFNPWSVDSIFNAVQKIRHDPDVALTLTRNGKDRLQNFSTTWEENGKLLATAILGLFNNEIRKDIA